VAGEGRVGGVGVDDEREVRREKIPLPRIPKKRDKRF